MSWKIIGALVLITVVVGSIVVYFMWNKPHADYESMDPEVRIEASVLFEEFNEGGEGAIKKYQGKIIELTGVVEKINTSSDSSKTILLKTETDGMGGVNARLHQKYNSGQKGYEKIENLTEGNQVKLKCRCQGFEDELISEVKMDNCFILSN